MQSSQAKFVTIHRRGLGTLDRVLHFLPIKWLQARAIQIMSILTVLIYADQQGSIDATIMAIESVREIIKYGRRLGD